MHIPHPSDSQELIGDSVRVLVQKIPPCRVELSVQVNPSLIQKARSQAIKLVTKEVTLPGFRKGKAPGALVLQKFPYDVAKQLEKELADLAFVEAQKVANVPVLNQNSPVSFELQKLDDQGASLRYRFETDPEVPSVDPALFHLQPVEKKVVGEKEVEEAIRQMAFFFAKWESVEDRAVDSGDFILINLDTIEEEKVERVFHEVRFEVNPERMAKWMRDLVLNARVGDVVEGMSAPDEDASEEEKKEFLPKKVRVSIVKVEKAFLPPIDDEFAKKVGAPNVAAMHELVKGSLAKQVEDKAKKDLEEQVNHFLVTQYVFDIPRSLVEAEWKHRYEEMSKRQDFMNGSENEKKQPKERIFQDAERSIRLFYLSREIVKDAKLTISNEEILDSALEKRELTHFGRGAQAGEITREEYALALSTLLLQKAQSWILSQKT